MLEEEIKSLNESYIKEKKLIKIIKMKYMTTKIKSNESNKLITDILMKK